MAFRALPTWKGPFGFAEVCSIKTERDADAEFFVASPTWIAPARICSASHTGFALKFK